MSDSTDLLAALGRSVEKAREARHADSRIERAARVLSTAPWDDLTVTEQVRWLNAATRLDAAGLLASPAHDAAVAARALREAADVLDGGIGTSTARFGMDPHDYDSRADYGYAVAEADLRACADRIEREGGAS